MKKYLKGILRFLISPLLKKYEKLQNEVEENRILLGKILIKQQENLTASASLAEAEFKVFSQWGEDGIIQYLISHVPIENQVFVEFGVEDYTESNTRFLLVNNNWRGLVMDGDERNINKIKSRDIYWRYDLTALEAFITKDNINSLIESAGISGDIGLLSIDIDGNDYWVWEAINTISPRIVICEYNSVFGGREAVSVPYDPDFNRTKQHYSNLYFGASLKALCGLAEAKGYIFAGSNSAGVNAFFVRKDVAGDLQNVDCLSGYVKSKTRESRDKSGNLTYISGDERIKVIKDMKVWDFASQKLKSVSEISL